MKTLVVAAGAETQRRSFPGRVEASRAAELAFQVPGLLIEIPVTEGQAVKRGDLIARLRPDEFAARLRTLQGNLDQARATLRGLQAGQRPEEISRLEAQLRAANARLANAQVEFQRSTQLLASRTISQAAFDQAQAVYRVAVEEHEAARATLEAGMIAREEDIEAAEAAVRGLEGQVVEAQLRLDDATLRSPCDGVIAKRFVEPNENVQAKQPIVRFQNVEQLDIQVDVPEVVMGTVRRSDIVELTAEFVAAPGAQFPVEISEVAQVADPVTQTFKVSVSLPQPKEVTVLPGMTAKVTLTYRPAQVLGTTLVVPVAAVRQDDQGQQSVWVIGDSDQVSRRPVTLGGVTGGSVEITSGLQPGERIATAGASRLRDGQKVRDLGDGLGGSP